MTSENIEEWRTVPGFYAYQVSDLGRVRRINAKGRWVAGHILKPGQGRSGHMYVLLAARSGVPARKQYVHRLVLMAFVGPPPFVGAFALHHDDVSTHNRPSNLYWGDHKQNVQDAKLNKKLFGEVSHRGGQPGELNSSAVLSIDDVLAIKRHLANGLCGTCIAKLYGVSKGTIYSIAKEHTWGNVVAVAAE